MWPYDNVDETLVVHLKWAHTYEMQRFTGHASKGSKFLLLYATGEQRDLIYAFQ